jgi:hypothetical protein
MEYCIAFEAGVVERRSALEGRSPEPRNFIEDCTLKSRVAIENDAIEPMPISLNPAQS